MYYLGLRRIETTEEYHVKVKRYVRGLDTSLYLALPKYWADEAGLRKNDQVEIEFLSRNELLVRVPAK